MTAFVILLVVAYFAVPAACFLYLRHDDPENYKDIGRSEFLSTFIIWLPMLFWVVFSEENEHD